MLLFFQLFTVILGTIVTLVPAAFSCYFFRDSGIGRVLAYMLLGETISMGIAVYFALNSYMHTYNLIAPEMAIALRWLIFTTTGVSTIKLILYIHKLKVKG